MKSLSILFTVFLLIVNIPTDLEAQDCNDCQYRQKTAACLDVKIGGKTEGSGFIELKFEAGGQVKCKSGNGTCTAQLCS